MVYLLSIHELEAEGEYVLLESCNLKNSPENKRSSQTNHVYFYSHSKYACKIQHMFNVKSHGRNSSSWFRLGNKEKQKTATVEDTQLKNYWVYKLYISLFSSANPGPTKFEGKVGCLI